MGDHTWFFMTSYFNYFNLYIFHLFSPNRYPMEKLRWICTRFSFVFFPPNNHWLDIHKASWHIHLSNPQNKESSLQWHARFLTHVVSVYTVFSFFFFFVSYRLSSLLFSFFLLSHSSLWLIVIATKKRNHSKVNHEQMFGY